MKRRLRMLLSTLAIAAAASSPPAFGAFVYENAAEFSAAGDFDGDGRLDIAIVDRLSGTYRLGYQLSAGAFTWAAPRASGIEAVSGLAVGRIASTSMDALAFAAPEANRVNVFAANNPGLAGLPLSLFTPNVGPRLVIALDIGGAGNTAVDDFIVGTVLNGSQPYQLEAARNLGTTLQILNTAVLGAMPRRGNPVTLKSGNPALAALLVREGSNEVFKGYQLGGGTLAEALSVPIAGRAEFDYASGFFDPGSSLAQFLFYQPGTNGLRLRPVQEPTPGSFALGTETFFELGDSLRQVFAIARGPAPRLLVIAGAGDTARIYAFDGIHAPVALQTFNSSAGEVFSGAAALAGGNVMLFTGAPGGSSSAFRYYTVSGSSYTLASSGALPAVSAASHRANVMTFQYEPFVASAPNLLQSFNAGDWVSLYVPQSGSQASVTFETFASSPGGLGSPAVQTLSPIHPLAQFALVNQYREPISLFRLTPAIGSQIADVNISPPPGTYKTSIQVSFNTADAQTRVYYRLDPTASWTLFNTPFWIFKDTTVSFYATPLVFTAPVKSVIRQAAYRFTESPSSLDSDGDGVPDYVEIAKGLDPVNSGADADGDGYSDLNELTRGTDPANDTSSPSAQARQDLHGAVDLIQAPQPVDGPSGLASDCAGGTVLRAFDLTGDLLSIGSAAYLGLPQLTGPGAVLSNVVVDVGMKLVAVATEPHFDIATSQADKRIGREMIRLLDTTSFVDPVSLPRTYAGGNLTSEADAWIAAASNQLSTVTRKQIVGNMGVYDTLAALLVERKVWDVLLSRGQAAYSNFTLFPSRVGDLGRTGLGSADLNALEQQTTNGLPGFQLRHLLHGAEGALASTPPALDSAAQLKALAWEIYRVSSASNNIPPGASTWPVFPLPVDALRAFIGTGVVHSNYLSSSAALGPLIGPAYSQAQAILNGLGPRPVVTLNLKIRADTFQRDCVPLDSFDGTQLWTLINSAGAPFKFVDSFSLPTGTVITAVGYTDVTNTACPGFALELISAALFAPPQFTSTDSDGDLLPDALELALFGNLSQKGTNDFDGDGFSNLQEIFDLTDPTDAASKGTTPVTFALPALQLQFASAGQLKLQFQWPAAYAAKVQFTVFGAPILGGTFSQLPAVQSYLGNDTFELTVGPTGTPAFFYQVALTLK